ncbi:hypothetical protein AYO52_10625 [Dietzia sp. 111N12-1]|nr:hypothetical protein AYO52_10625 [Dietzia sp. 111N12-1]
MPTLRALVRTIRARPRAISSVASRQESSTTVTVTGTGVAAMQSSSASRQPASRSCSSWAGITTSTPVYSTAGQRLAKKSAQ